MLCVAVYACLARFEECLEVAVRSRKGLHAMSGTAVVHSTDMDREVGRGWVEADWVTAGVSNASNSAAIDAFEAALDLGIVESIRYKLPRLLPKQSRVFPDSAHTAVMQADASGVDESTLSLRRSQGGLLLCSIATRAMQLASGKDWTAAQRRAVA